MTTPGDPRWGTGTSPMAGGSDPGIVVDNTVMNTTAVILTTTTQQQHTESTH